MTTRDGSWTDLCAYVFPHLVHFLSNMLDDPSIFEIGPKAHLKLKSAVWRADFCSLNFEALLAASCSESGLTLSLSTARHHGGGWRIFLAWSIKD